MSEKILVFAGTTEGRLLAEYLGSHGISAHICVATEYGEQLVKKSDSITVSAGRLDCEGMQNLIREGFSLVIDATHPYAVIVSSNIKDACTKTGVEYMRLLRQEGSRQGDVVEVSSVEEAVKYLRGTEGNILVATGSKEIAKFTELDNYKERVFARVLSTASVAKACSDLGFEGNNLICMQGPFCEELNYGMLKQISAKYMVTKDSGKVGGFEDKIRAAKRAGVQVVLVGRPQGDKGRSYDEVISELNLRFGINTSSNESYKPKRKVTLVGIGMGNSDQLTLEAVNACENADIIIGAERMLSSVKTYCSNTFNAYISDEIIDFIKSHEEYSNIVVALSGDVGFYSAAKKLIEAVKKEGYELKLVCGISSVVYLCSRLNTSWEDVNLLSVHGRDANIIASVKSHKKTFTLLSGSDSVRRICASLIEAGLESVMLYVGENLSYDNEKITSGCAADLNDRDFGKLCVVLIVNDQADSTNPLGIPDDDFIRGTAPMTKSEVRTLSVTKLKLKPDSVVYDIGAGTGSVSVEMALVSHDGTVYAIEKEEEAADLIRHNKAKFGTPNLEIIHGTAPEAIKDLPAPTHAFIGGSSGNLSEIVQTLLSKNKDVKIVITAVTLETVSEALSCMTNFDFKCREVIQLSVSKSREIGNYNLMTAQNPVYIFTLSGASRCSF